MDRERRLAVTEFSRDLAVDASAGTGKTATLIARVTNLLLAKKDLGPDDVLLLTFTDKAAAEMKSRVVEGWELLLSASRAATSLEEAGEEVRAWNSLIEIPAEGFLTLDDLREASTPGSRSFRKGRPRTPGTRRSGPSSGPSSGGRRRTRAGSARSPGRPTGRRRSG
jgi:hypothetical protein